MTNERRHAAAVVRPCDRGSGSSAGALVVPVPSALVAPGRCVDRGDAGRRTRVGCRSGRAIGKLVRYTGPGLRISGRDGSSPTQVPWGAVLMATAAGALAALVLVRVANRTTRPRLTFAVAVVAGLALSCVPPVQAATTTRTALVLLVMHLIVAIVLVPPAARMFSLAGLESEWEGVLAGRVAYDFRIWRWVNFLRWAELLDVHLGAKVG